MKTITLFLICLFVFISSVNPDTTDKEVYICNGKASTKYHLVNDCKGLENCSTDVVKVTLTEAKEMGRTLCGWED